MKNRLSKQAKSITIIAGGKLYKQFLPQIRKSDFVIGVDRGALFARIDRAIEPFDTAGLLDGTRRSWYPVLAADLVAGAPKLDATVDEIHRLLDRCGFDPHHVSSSTAAGPTRNSA